MSRARHDNRRRRFAIYPSKYLRRNLSCDTHGGSGLKTRSRVVGRQLFTTKTLPCALSRNRVQTVVHRITRCVVSYVSTNDVLNRTRNVCTPYAAEYSSTLKPCTRRAMYCTKSKSCQYPVKDTLNVVLKEDSGNARSRPRLPDESHAAARSPPS